MHSVFSSLGTRGWNYSGGTNFVVGSLIAEAGPVSEGSVSLPGDFFRQSEVTATPNETGSNGYVTGINENDYYADFPFGFRLGILSNFVHSNDASAPCSRLVR